MTTRFDPNEGLILVRTAVHGPRGKRLVRLALDTGATTTMIRTATLVTLGYDPAMGERVPMTTASGIEYVPRIRVWELSALGEERTELSVVAHTLPPSSIVQGLLGLDFFRGRELNIDFRRGLITIR